MRGTNLAAVAAVLIAANLAAGPFPQPSINLLLLACAAAVLELSAARLYEFGLFSSAVAVYMALAADPTGGSRAAVGILVLLLLVRALIRGRGDAARRMAEALWDGSAVLGAITAAAFLPGPWPARLGVGAAVFVGVSSGLARTPPIHLEGGLLLRWHRVARSTLPLRMGAALASGAVLVSLEANPAAILCLIPALWGLHLAAENAVFRAQSDEVETVHQELDHARRALERSREYVGDAHRELRTTLEERRILEGFSQHLAGSPDLGETLDLILETVLRLVACTSVVVFSREQHGLVPVSARGPDQDRLENADLLNLKEPIVEAAWSLRETVCTQPEHLRTPRLFEKERQAAALPLEDQGVLYVGRVDGEPLSERDLHFLKLVAGAAALALQSSRRHSAEQLALHEHAQARRGLEQWLSRLAVLLDASRAMASTLDPEQLLEELQRRLASLATHDYGTIVAGSLSRRWGPAEAPEAAKELQRVVTDTRKPLLIDELDSTRFPPPAKGVRSVLAVPIVGEQRVEGAILVGSCQPEAFQREHQDLFLMLAYQAAVALANIRLFQAVVEARRQLEESQAQLIQSSKMAAVGQLAAGVAHELNSPLAAVILSLDSAQDKVSEQPDKAVKKLDRARRAAERAKKIIEKLLFYARKTEGREEPIEPAALVADTLIFLEHQLRLDEVVVVQDLQPSPVVTGSANELQQVMINLILNARDAYPPGTTRRIRVFTTGRDGQAVLGVQDWGEGITPEAMERIFEPFFTTREVGSGTGLGLSVSQRIVQQVGGRIEVRSQPGEGSTFEVVLPG